MDAWLARLYERHPRRYVVGIPIGAVSAVLPLVTVGALATGAHYHGLSVAQFGVAMGLLGFTVALTALGVMFAARRQLRTLAAWGRRGGDELAEDALAAAYELPRRTVILVIIGVNFLAIPTAAIALTLPVDHLTALDVFEIYVGGLIATLYAAVLMYGIFELALRPVRATIHLDARPKSPPLGLGGRLLLALFLTPMVVATIAGGLQVERDSGSLWEIYAVSLGVTLLGLLTLGLFVEGAVLRPVRELIGGTRMVGSGDLDVKVPVTTDDELGELTFSFNEMVDELRRSADELRASRARIVAASDEARRGVERDLHDGAQQHLVLLNLKLGALQGALESDPGRARAILDDARGDLERGLAELRDLAHGIYPPVLTNDGLAAALAEAANKAAIPTQVSCDGTGRYRSELEAAVFFCCLEALQNAGKHAGDGANATVAVSERDARLRFEVADDGRGFDAGAAHGSAGLQNMADRIGALGGELSIEAEPGRGVRVEGSVPVAASPEASGDSHHTL